jgi:multidrug efflux pump subunit AcrB
MDAAIEAMREVQGAVIGIVLVLAAVFIPVAFLGGIAGQLYRQFAVTVAVAVVLSGVVALTLTPALCALLLKADHGPTAARVADGCSSPSTVAFGWITRRFMGAVHLALAHRLLALLLFAGVLGGCGAGCWPRCRAASCRPRTRATSSPPRSCPTAPRSSAPAPPPSGCG